MTLLVLNEETALRKVEAEYKASRPGVSGVSGGTATTMCSVTCWTASVPACWKASTARWRI